MSESLKMLLHTLFGLSFFGLSVWLLIGAIKHERNRQIQEREKIGKKR